MTSLTAKQVVNESRMGKEVSTARSRSTSAGSGTQGSSEDGKVQLQPCNGIRPPPGLEDATLAAAALCALRQDGSAYTGSVALSAADALLQPKNFGVWNASAAHSVLGMPPMPLSFPPAIISTAPPGAAWRHLLEASRRHSEASRCHLGASRRCLQAPLSLPQVPLVPRFPPPPPSQPPVLGATQEAPPQSQPPTQAPVLDMGITAAAVSPPPFQPPVLPPPLQTLPPPPSQPPVLDAAVRGPKILPPPSSNVSAPLAMVVGRQMQPPPPQAPILGEELQMPSIPPPPAQAPLLHLVDEASAFEHDTSALLSKGSAEHSLGTCKPCAFVHAKGCSNGKNCIYCHLCEPGEKKRRMKEKRELLRVTNQLG